MLGRYLFYDFRLSVNDSRSCGICHEPAKGYTDGFVVSVGAFDDPVNRNALSLVNVGYREILTWRDPSQTTLEHQMNIPLSGDNPVEMGMTIELFAERFEAIDLYPPLFLAAFPKEPSPLNLANAIKAIAVFERTIVGDDTPYDRWLTGDEDALDASARRGMDLFFSEALHCDRCHGGLFFDASTNEQGEETNRHGYFNTGLYDLDGQGAYPQSAEGLITQTGLPEDMGVFRVPSLRGVTTSGPWLHDGSALFLEDVLDSYARAGRQIHSGDRAGDGAMNPYKSDLITGFEMSLQDRSDLLDFLDALTDESVLTRAELQDPYEDDEES
jgi:cytochrome c peroxidase